MRITKAPGDRTADTPEWICITNQRINPFKHLEDAPPRNKKNYIVDSFTPGYVCTNIAVDKYKVCKQTLRRWNRLGLVRTVRQKHATMYLESDLQRVIEQRRTA